MRDKVVKKSRVVGLAACAAMMVFSGCMKPGDYHRQADKAAGDIITQSMEKSLGASEDFSVERPSDVLRRRLMVAQDLQRSHEGSLGSDNLVKPEHWPADLSLEADTGGAVISGSVDKVVSLSLIDALQIGAMNNNTFQSRKESVFKAALSLDLERNDFRNIFDAQIKSNLSSDTTGSRAVSGFSNSGQAGWSRQLENGARLSSVIAVDLANLLTGSKSSSMGLRSDSSITIPLLRGSGRHIITEPLTQAERNVVYAIYDFVRYRQTYAVQVAGEYFSVLTQMDQLRNSAENYRSLIASARRSRRLADAGRLPEIQVDQAVQNELRARERWISARQSLEKRLDSFKDLLGLPVDSMIELKESELESITETSKLLLAQIEQSQSAGQSIPVPAADEAIELEPVTMENAGKYEIAPETAIDLAFEYRYDLMTAQGRVEDAQRQVVVAADALGAELTLGGSAGFGSSRSVGSAGADDAKIRYDKGSFAGLLTLDLPLERTAERNSYRNSVISLEQTVRSLQDLENNIKESVRNNLRDLLEARASLEIQARSVFVANKRVKSINLFLEAGRAEIRDLLEAQESLLSAQNSLTSAAVNYRLTELELQRDMGVLEVNEKGIWKEFSPEGL